MRNGRSVLRHPTMGAFALISVALRSVQRPWRCLCNKAQRKLSCSTKPRSILQRRTDFRHAANQKSAFNSLGQVFSGAPSPIVEKHDTWLFMRHVLMNGDNVDLVFKQ